MENLSQSSEDGLLALQKGDMRYAFSKLSEAFAKGADDENTLLGLAISAREIERHDISLQMAGRLLELESGNVEALILKADALAATGDQRQAAAHYVIAVQAAPPPAQMNSQLASEVERARKECATAAVQYEEFLRSNIRDLGLYDGSGRARGEQALDILFGGKQIYYQQPEKFYFPELPQVQFYDPSDFPWTRDLIAKTEVIRAELEAILASPDNFEAYVPAVSKTPHLRDNALMGNEDWGAFHLLKDGVQVEKNARRCPATIEALKAVPAPNVPGKSPMALFSRFKPGAHLPPHTGLMNTRIICHLPLIAPDGCRIRVGNQERQWRMGEMLIFDDSIEHEAVNAGKSQRVILLFDIWRPELSEDDRAFISAVFEAIEEFGVF
ncbi:MAG: aspartyl/asparaginyl beta-hydroxylase domain-containing protein [Alphaproteobacteria bacterium]|nr:aspartyl/asparaginyl beta-hydroxylase domain-containing protein [Alphaproteobacteria bacterium]